MNKRIKGHVLVCMIILAWGITFTSARALLRDLMPLQILFTRFMTGYLASWAITLRLTRIREKKEELYFLAVGLCGVTLYFLMESIVFTYTQTSNVDIIVTVSPLFTMFSGIWLLKQTRPGVRFFIGFLIVMTGILYISLEGSQNLALNPKGGLPALRAAIVWALYSTITKKISNFEYTTIPMIRRIFFYSLLCMLPVIMLSGMELLKVEQLTRLNTANILFLGLGVNAMCFVSWNSATCTLGAVQTGVYIYAVSAVATLASVWILKETVVITGVPGIVTIVLGLLLSQNCKGERAWRKTENASW